MLNFTKSLVVDRRFLIDLRTLNLPKLSSVELILVAASRVFALAEADVIAPSNF